MAATFKSVMPRSPLPETARRRWPGSALLGLALSLTPLAAAAQLSAPLLPLPSVPTAPQLPPPGTPSAYPGQTVGTLFRPDFAPIGARFGDFFFFPHAEVDEEFNSNIFALPSAASDWITTLAPGFDILSDFPSSALNLHASAANQFYAKNPTQDTQSGLISANGSVDVNNISSISGSVIYNHSYIPRSSPNSPGNAAEPVTYDNYTASVRYAETGLRLGYEADLAVAGIQYNNTPAFGGGILQEEFGNVVTPQVAGELNYEFVPDYRGFVRLSGSYYYYPHIAPGGVNTNSNVYSLDAGLNIAPRHLIWGQVYFGYLYQTYHTASLGTFSAPDYGGRLYWTPTPLWTVTLNGMRDFVSSSTNTPVSGIGTGYLQSIVIANLDHELRYDVILNANASYENDNFIGITRSDNVFTAGAGVRYLVSRNLFLAGTYSYQQRTSNAAGINYDQSIVMLQIGTQF
jgi:hypothetical protein